MPSRFVTLFAVMHQESELDVNIDTTLGRLLLQTRKKEVLDWTQHPESMLSVLATRVQMGSTNLSVASDLVAKGYANLTDVTSNFATFVYVPDPVCARLAMCMMDETWKYSKYKGKDKKWWSNAVKTLYSTGLCLPTKGDLGEVFTALHFLFCGDECRKTIDGNMNYTTFSVPLEDWIESLFLKESSSESTGTQQCEPSEFPEKKRTESAGKQQHNFSSGIQINFIQVCRDYTRSTWSGLADQGFLENLYNAGTAFYTYPGCELIDFVAPTKITLNNTTTYSSVLVSIKSRKYLSPGEAKKICVDLKKEVKTWKLTGALCVVCVFGQTTKSDYKEFTYDASMMNKLADGENVATVLCLPRDDRFGLTNIFLEMTGTTKGSELLSSHSFLRARSLQMEAEDALQSLGVKIIAEVQSKFQRLKMCLHPEMQYQ